MVRDATRIAGGPKDLAIPSGPPHRGTILEPFGTRTSSSRASSRDTTGAFAAPPPNARGGRGAAVGPAATATMAATLAAATAEAEEDTFGWGSIYFDGEEGDEENEEDMEEEIPEGSGRVSTTAAAAAGWAVGSGEGTAAAAANDGEGEEREYEEGPGFELQDTVIAGRWRQRRRQGRQEIYFDGTTQSSEQGRPQRDSSEERP